jgi:hypothetical protein
MRAGIIRVKLLLITFLFILSFQARATITIQSVGGVSYFEKDTNNNFTIYGGMTGTAPGATAVLNCTGDGSTTCDSCVSATTVPATACNKLSVYGSLKISITFSSSVALNAAKIKITTDNGDSSTTEATEYNLSSATVTASIGENKTVTLDWGYLCNADTSFNNENCFPTPANTLETSFKNTARKIYLYVDQNADSDLTDTDEKISIDAKLHYIKSDEDSNNKQAFCNSPQEAQTNGAIGNCGYILGIGDSKLYIQQLFGSSVAGDGTPPAKTSIAPDWYGLAFYAYDVANVGLIPSSIEPQIRIYDATFAISDNTVTGLNNYQNYCLLMGNINKAQNIYKYNFDAADPLKTCGQPSEVIGMLSDKSCFISTAAFGSDMADQVQLLRKFRNEFLLTNSWGKAFVKTYYKLSPPVAHFIEHSEILKAMTRTALYPFIFMAWLALSYGILPVAILILILFSSLYFILKKRRALHA